jgi:hypothetical protein
MGTVKSGFLNCLLPPGRMQDLLKVYTFHTLPHTFGLCGTSFAGKDLFDDSAQINR